MFSIHETKSQFVSEYDQFHEFIIDFIAADDISPENINPASERHWYRFAVSCNAG